MLINRCRFKMLKKRKTQFDLFVPYKLSRTPALFVLCTFFVLLFHLKLKKKFETFVGFIFFPLKMSQHSMNDHSGNSYYNSLLADSPVVKQNYSRFSTLAGL